MKKKKYVWQITPPLRHFWAIIKCFHFYFNPEKSQVVLQNQQCIPKCLNSSHPDPGEKSSKKLFLKKEIIYLPN